MRVLFRFEANAQIGLGHQSRCLALARSLRHVDGFSGTVAARDTHLLPSWMSRIELVGSPDDETEFAKAVNLVEPDLIIADCYALTSDWYEAAARIGPPMLRISDFPTEAPGCRFVLDQSPAHRPSDYASAEQAGSELMVGADWALIDPSFFNHRHLQRRAASGESRLLISMGSGSGDGVAEQILRQTSGIEDSVAITVIGRGDEARERLAAIAAGLHHEVQLESFTENMARLAYEHDLAVGAGGVAALERCVVGLPSALCLTAENQRPNLHALVVAGAGVECDAKDAARSIEELRGSALEIGRAARAVCDGLGAIRCARALGVDIPVKLAAAALATNGKQLAFGHQHIAGIRRHSRSTDAPTWDEHSVWFDETMARPERELFFIEVAEFVVGQIRLDQREGDSREVSILLVPEARGMSIGSSAIREIARRSTHPLVAYISPENPASITAFRAAGFTQRGPDRYTLDHPAAAAVSTDQLTD